MIRLLPITFVLLTAFAGKVFSQTYLMNGTPINDCSGTFYDSGGSSGSYGDNQNLVTTICSDGSAGTHIQLTFSGVDLIQGDEICFYDGPNTAAPLLSCSGDYLPGSPFVVQATAVNPGGCLTATFNSDASGHASGWSAVITCVPSCQTVLADLVSTNPASVPLDTGWIDLCPGERVFFTGAGVYPQNGFAYQQSDLTTVFEWNFGDGDISYGPNTSHRYDEPGGYFVQLFLTDAQGCRSTNLINQRIRVAPRPSFALTGLINSTICAGDTVLLNAGLDSSSTGKTLMVLPVPSSFNVEGSRSDSLALPDGTGVPYKTSIFFSEFSPGQVLTDPNDLENICVNMEHSWMRDMEINIACPNGQSIVLHNFGGQMGSEVFLGIPNDNDVVNPVPGTGYDYCWTPNAPNPTWLQYANAVLPGGGTLPSGNYTPFEPFSDLVGCPLNGEWTITVTDLWPIDNGYIFSWGIKFKDALYPDIETFTPQFTSWHWNTHPSIYFSTPDSIAASPQNGGTAGYVFTVNDEFGCSWDTLVSISVLPPTHPACHTCTDNFVALQDTSVCASEPVMLNANSLNQDTFEVRFEAFPDYRLGNANHPHSNPYVSPISVNSVGYNLLTNPAAQITSVCIDIETDFDADLNIYLRSPDGKQLDLSTGNGAAGDNYKITCFSPAATIPIIGNAAPFNGTFKPEGNWASLNGAVVNGDWKLVVSDGFGINQYGKVKWWSIGFNFFNTVSYNWTNTPSLSCGNCPNPIATPAATTTYIVTTTDKFLCHHQDTAVVQINALFPAPGNLEVTSLGVNTMTWSWDSVQGAAGYEVRVNGGPWIPANGGLSHAVGNLVSGDSVNIEVQALSGSANCPPGATTGSHVFVVCLLEASAGSVLPALCAGTATGSASITVVNATPPVEYYANGMGPAFLTGNLNNIFPAGNQFVEVRDADGCRDTAFFVITEPPPIVLTTTFTNALCNGDPDGSANASATGGTGAFSYYWQGCAGGVLTNTASVSDLYAGCYAVTATDANGCSLTDSVIIGEPLPFQFTGIQDSVTCNGGADGSATIQVQGGTTPYQYSWGIGGNTPGITGLAAGFYFVNVKDTSGCEAATFVQVFEPPLLVIDSTAAKSVSCFGGNNGTAAVFVHGGIPPYKYLWSDLQNTQKALSLSAGTYTVTITDANGCTMHTQVVVLSPTEVSTVFANVSGETCSGDCQGQATIQASGGTGPYSYFWSTTQPVILPTATGLCPGSYTVTVTDFRGCSKTDKVTITAATPIDVHLQPAAPSCAGLSNGMIETQVSGGSPPYQFSWSDGSSLINPQNLPCGTYFLTITDAAGCTKVDSVALACPAPVQILAILPQKVTCFGLANGQITVHAQGGVGTLSYLWSDPNAQIDSVVVGLPAGMYGVTVSDVNGCSASASATVEQPDILVATTTQTNVTCFGGNDGVATVFPGGGTPAYSYTWNGTGADQKITGLPAGNYTAIITDANGCTTSAAVSITQPAGAVAVTLTQSALACFGQNNGQALAAANGGNGTPYLYQWSNGQTGATATGLSTGTITVTATDSKGCSSAQSIEIQQLEEIDINVAFVPPSCHGYTDGQAAVNHISGGAGMGDTTLYNYLWSTPNSPNSIYINGLAGGQNYSITVSDLQGCSGVFSFFITQPPPIIAQLTIKNVSCFGFPDGSIMVDGVQGANLPVTYIWSNSTTGPFIENLPAADYMLTIQDADGCVEKDTIPVSQPDMLQVNFDIKPLVCSGDSDAEITATVLGGTPEYTLHWNNMDTTSLIKGLGPGVYTVQISDKNGCTLTDSTAITRPDSIDIQAEKTDPQCFGGADGQIRLHVSGGQKPYRYSLNGGAFGGSSSFIGLSAGIYQFQIKDDNGCITGFTGSLEQPLPVAVSLGADTTILLGDSLLIIPEVFDAFGAVQYKWKSVLLENFICVDTPECSMIWAKPYQTNTYRVTVTDENGCRGTDDITINVLKPRGVYVPSGFTPNGDLTNDLLVVYGKSRQISSVLSFRVYDRWGELVYRDENFDVNDETRGWDGRFRGKECDPGVYVWYVEVEYQDGYREALSGDITLIR